MLRQQEHMMSVAQAARTNSQHFEASQNRKAARGARFFRSSFARGLEVVDLFTVFACVAVTLRIYTQNQLLAASLAVTLPMFCASLGLWWVLRENDLYHFTARPNPFTHFFKTFGSVIIALPLAIIIGFATSAIAGRPWIECVKEATFITALTGTIISIYHFIAAAIVGSLNQIGFFSLNVVIVGATDQAQKIIEDKHSHDDIFFMGIFDDRLDRAPSKIKDIPVIGDLEDLMNWPLLPVVDRVVIAVSSAAQHRVVQLTEKLRAMPNKLVLALDMQGFDADGTTLGKLGAFPIAYVSGTPEDARRAFWKRVQDIVIASIALLVLSPIMIITAIAIAMDSKGPILFRQTRHGFNNQPFKCWKFRSMYVEMTDHKASQQVTKDDPRVTKVGRFIRKTSLDELPQLFNVISGDMSLVGPRPHAIGMKTGDALSEKLVRDYAHRHRIKPGITGWAAINGSRGPVHTSAEVRDRVRFDTDYIDNSSFWLDLYIMAMTIPSLLGDKKAIR
ncbi:MAG: exopolysaccharide biosynthesis polyprenyl glycosylphosphotransferase [Pseudomonadota bacterium]